MKTVKLFLFFAPVLFSCAGLHAQVTIGDLTEPAAGAILDLNTINKGGLLLSNVTIADLDFIPAGNPDIFPGIIPATADENLALRGAMVYNDGQNPAVPAGIYIWNGYRWTKDGRFTPAEIPAGTGTLQGRPCFDVAKTNDDEKSGKLFMRQNITTGTAKPFDFSLSAASTYTFTPQGSVSKLRFHAVEQDPAYDGKIVESLSYDKNLETQTGISTAQTVGVIYKSNLNNTAGGKYNTEALKVDIYAVYNTVRDGVDIERAVKLTASIQDCQCCGAFTVDGQWLNFMCHNLGADENLNPFEWNNTAGGDNAIDNDVPDGVAGQYKDIKGWLFQWGRKADGHQYRNSTTSDVPSTLSLYRTSPSGLFYINSFDWITDGNTDEGRKRWGDGTDNANPAKAPDDPCPAGWKVPSIKQLYSIFKDNVANDTGYSYNIAGTANVWTPTGTWTPGSGSGGYKVGDALYLPATGQRTYEGGMGAFMGAYGYYWGSTLNTNSACFLYFNGNTVYPNYSFYQTRGHSVRCVSE